MGSWRPGQRDCEQCHQPLPYGARSDARFCGDACRKRHTATCRVPVAEDVRDRLSEDHWSRQEDPAKLPGRHSELAGSAFIDALAGQPEISNYHGPVAAARITAPLNSCHRSGRQLICSTRPPRITRVNDVLVERGHVLLIHQPGQHERFGAGAVPATGWLPLAHRAGVVVLPTGRDLAGSGTPRSVPVTSSAWRSASFKINSSVLPDRADRLDPGACASPV